MRVETESGTAFRLTYGADGGGEPAVGFDRSALDPALLRLAETAGADVRRGWTATGVELDAVPGVVRTRHPDGTETAIAADVIVGADGLRSLVDGVVAQLGPDDLAEGLDQLAADERWAALAAQLRRISSGETAVEWDGLDAFDTAVVCTVLRRLGITGS